MNALTSFKLAATVGVLCLLTACIAPQRPTDWWAEQRQPDGSVTWLDEFNFIPPPSPWRVLDINENDFSLAFFRSCAGDEPSLYPCEATIAYAGEPFGYSQELRQRQREFFNRFLWASRLIFADPELTATSVDGREALIAITTGAEPVQGQQVRTKVVFVKRGDRIEAFFMNQWRAKNRGFDVAEFAAFDRFLSSFKYLKPSFYETL